MLSTYIIDSIDCDVYVEPHELEQYLKCIKPRLHLLSPMACLDCFFHEC